MVSRRHGRGLEELRPLTIETGVLRHAEGSALISMGDTRVLCAASVEHGVPRWLRGTGSGWVTAEYGMLPRSTHTRSAAARRDEGRQGGRSQEIQRLIGRSLRAASWTSTALGEQTITVDCDVIQADGGTRTAAITGGWVALAHGDRLDAARRRTCGRGPADARRSAAISVGLSGGDGAARPRLRPRTHSAEADFNVVQLGTGQLVEVQGTAERAPYSRARPRSRRR